MSVSHLAYILMALETFDRDIDVRQSRPVEVFLFGLFGQLIQAAAKVRAALGVLRCL